MTTRTDAETKLLREEAGRRAREGWRRPEISRALGVPLHTLARWAFEDGWRQKDLATEGEPERLAALAEHFAQQRAQHVRSACGRSAGRVGVQIEYKSAEFDSAAPQSPPPDPAPDLRYPSNDPDYGPWDGHEKLPKFLTRGGDPDEQVCWAAPQLWTRTPPWAPGNAIEAPEFASLFLAEDLMRQGLLSEAEKALRFTKTWLQVSKQVFDKQDQEDAARRAYHERQEEEREQEKARCKALGLPDPVEEFEARFRTMAMASGRGNSNSNNNNSNITTAARRTDE